MSRCVQQASYPLAQTEFNSVCVSALGTSAQVFHWGSPSKSANGNKFIPKLKLSNKLLSSCKTVVVPAARLFQLTGVFWLKFSWIFRWYHNIDKKEPKKSVVCCHDTTSWSRLKRLGSCLSHPKKLHKWQMYGCIFLLWDETRNFFHSLFIHKILIQINFATINSFWQISNKLELILGHGEPTHTFDTCLASLAKTYPNLANYTEFLIIKDGGCFVMPLLFAK